MAELSSPDANSKTLTKNTVPALIYFFMSEGGKINPLMPSVPNMRRNAKILILILEGIIKKISYERRDYESVDEKKTYLRLCPEKVRKKEFRQ